MSPVLSFCGVALSDGSVAGSDDAVGVTSGPDEAFAWDVNKAQHWLLRAIATGRLSLDGLVTHTIAPEGLGDVYEGLLKDKENYLGVVVKWA